MRPLFQSGTAFMIVSALCFLAATLGVVKGLQTDNMNNALVAVFAGNAVIWLVIAIAVRNKNRTKSKPDSES